MQVVADVLFFIVGAAVCFGAIVFIGWCIWGSDE